jgi:hypothetical protein
MGSIVPVTAGPYPQPEFGLSSQIHYTVARTLSKPTGLSRELRIRLRSIRVT